MGDARIGYTKIENYDIYFIIFLTWYDSSEIIFF
jgi:hypothetical protein